MRITAAESLVMEALWSRGPLTTDEIIGEVGAEQGWGEATVRTLIHRLLRKKALAGRRADGRLVAWRSIPGATGDLRCGAGRCHSCDQELCLTSGGHLQNGAG